ncbi:helical backbone metal receptor [Mucilaginibacter sp.]|jgi:ABC-type Fe3+-hydroxamate transport system substrate-binding protein|uniref:helical backbone metal receptor n=1 Tax=Mucilaginibacter sp. TaxID=1882438 RepID=UPI002C75B394|nr:helical backbone metal receptor [Mucilaginibacter sp.]HTI61724.1 helical backbone metal receptor [Mucilaginibacter sp.]
MPIFYDQMNRAVELASIPKKIISIVPSQTELLFDLGLDEEITGITKFCIHPAATVKQKVKVGGTKQLNIRLIKELNPDLIIGNKEENEQTQIEELMELFPVWMSDISDLDGALDMIGKVGALVGKSENAGQLSNQIKQQFSYITSQQINLRVAYLIWRKPYMVAGNGTFIDDMLQKCGMVNAFTAERYPEVSNEQLLAAKPDVVLLSSEPYPFGDQHIREFESLLREAKIKLVDGEMFSWYGSRLLRAPKYFKELVNSLQAV